MKKITDEQYLQKIGKRIIRRRRKLGISQLELAKRLNTSNTQLRRVEQGKTNSAILFLRHCAQELRISISTLLD
jgi:transcriptional regulator with XRE-family HTH domain